MEIKLTRMLPWIAVAVAALLSVLPKAAAQDNAICTSTTGCTGTQPSLAFIDVSVKSVLGTDICQKVYNVLFPSGYPVTGEVIDARGLPVQGVSMVCATGTSPWYQPSTGYVNKPSTILLPTGTITIPKTWVLPTGTKLIGEGSGLPTTLPLVTDIPQSTIIQACVNGSNGCTANFSGPILQFGSSNGTSRISVEDVLLNGNGLQNVNGIENDFSQELTYVDRVTLYQILGTGLLITNNASNSGPYTNLTFDTGNYSPVFGTTTCAQINGVSGGTRGIHGLDCIGRSTNGQNAVLLDSSNNSLEDIKIIGFDEGVVVGSNAPAVGNVLLNIYGDTPQPPTGIVVVNVVVISSATTSGNPNVSNLSIMGLRNAGGTGTQTLADELTNSPPFTDSSIGMYVLGQPKSGGYTRYTTSPNAATWVVGNPNVSSVPGTVSCKPGSLYSNPRAASGIPVLYVCAVGSNTWKPIM